MKFAAFAAVIHGAVGLASALEAQVPPAHLVDTLPWNVAAGRLGSVRLGFALLYDVDSYRQTPTNELQVGELVPLGTVRTARLILDGTFGSGRRAWRYLAAAEPNRLEDIDPPELTVKDLALSIPAGGNVWISVGRQKEGASQDILLGTRTQPYSERSAAVTEFLPTRNDGVRIWHSGPFTTEGRWGWSLGAFDSFLFNGDSFRGNGGQYAARVFAAPIADDTTGRVVQLAFDVRVTGAQDGFIQFKSKPEVDAAPNFVNTGLIPASSATTFDLEGLAQHRSLAFVAELLPTFVAGTPDGTLTFLGWYAGRELAVGRRCAPLRQGCGLARARRARRAPVRVRDRGAFHECGSDGRVGRRWRARSRERGGDVLRAARPQADGRLRGHDVVEARDWARELGDFSLSVGAALTRRSLFVGPSSTAKQSGRSHTLPGSRAPFRRRVPRRRRFAAPFD
jgi:hypothetical protein